MFESCLPQQGGELVMMTGLLIVLAIGVPFLISWLLARGDDAPELVDLSSYELLPAEPRRATPPPVATYQQAKLPF